MVRVREFYFILIDLKVNKHVLVPEAEIRKYPKTWEYLLRHKHELEERQKGKLKGSSWYGLSFASSLEMFSSKKIITPTLSPMNSFSLDVEGKLFPQGAGGGCGLVPKKEFSSYYLLGLLNSRLLTFFFQRISSPFQNGWFAYEPRYLERIPIRTINFSDPADKARHDKMVSLVERMLELHKQAPPNLPAKNSGQVRSPSPNSANLERASGRGRTPQDQEMVKREIESTDREIDQLVYELYGLSEDDIKIVEKQ